MSAITCPVGRSINVEGTEGTTTDPCPTQLQPYRGRLTEGVRAHLETVHRLPTDAATAEAKLWVDGAGRHASR